MVKVSITSVVALIAATSAVNALNIPLFGSSSTNELAARGEFNSQAQQVDERKKHTTTTKKHTTKKHTTKKHTTKKPHGKPSKVKGRAFDHFLQVWFENQVKIS